MRPLAKLTGSDRRKGFRWLDDPELGGSYWTNTTSWTADREEIAHDFEGYIDGAYKRNGIVFACIEARALPFSEARFLYQRFNDGRPGDLFAADDGSLDLLERPWPNGTTGELLHRMEQDASLAGNFYATTVGTGSNERIRRLRPDWVTIISGIRGDDDGSPWELNAEVLGYIYAPRSIVGNKREVKPTLLTPDRVVHYSPIPDPAAQWRGMSWLTPVIREIEADTSTTSHKLKFFDQGATPPFAIKYDPALSAADFKAFVALFNESYAGAKNAYKVLHLGGGADPVTIGTDLKQLDFKAVQGAGETRIAAAAGVGAIIARFSEGMQGSSLNAGNYGAAKRQFADMTVRPNWRVAASSLSKFTSPPPVSRLWYDARDIAFLAEDQKDAAEILSSKATTIRQLVDAGYGPDAAVRAVLNDDLALLAGQHSGRYSVQLLPLSDSDGVATPRDIAEMLQKIYLAVGPVITAEEARAIVNRAGADLTGAPPAPV